MRSCGLNKRLTSSLRFTLLVLGSLVVNGSVSGYELTGTDWSYQANPMGEDWRVCTTNLPASGSQRTKDGAAIWNYSGFQFTFGSDACFPGGYPNFDDWNVVTYGSGLAAGVLAQTTWWFQGSNTVECDMRFSDRYGWYTGTGFPGPSQYDWWSVAAHEMGHCLGLGHSASPSAVMYFSISAGTTKRQLTNDDIAGRNAIYDGDEPLVCPLEISLQDAPRGDRLLDLMRRLRDEVLSRDARGTAYVDLYYRHALELSLLVLRDPTLNARMQSLIETRSGKMLQVLLGKPIALTPNDIEEIDRLLADMQSVADPDLDAALWKLREELADGTLLSVFGPAN